MKFFGTYFNNGPNPGRVGPDDPAVFEDVLIPRTVGLALGLANAWLWSKDIDSGIKTVFSVATIGLPMIPRAFCLALIKLVEGDEVLTSDNMVKLGSYAAGIFVGVAVLNIKGCSERQAMIEPKQEMTNTSEYYAIGNTSLDAPIMALSY